MPIGNGDGNDSVFQDAISRRQRPLRTDVSQGKPGLLGIQVHLHSSSIYNAIHRVFDLAFGLVCFCLKSSPARQAWSTATLPGPA